MKRKPTQLEMFYAAHRQVADKYNLFAEIQRSDNPLTDDERRKLATKYPNRYGFMMPREKPNG